MSVICIYHRWIPWGKVISIKMFFATTCLHIWVVYILVVPLLDLIRVVICCTHVGCRFGRMVMTQGTFLLRVHMRIRLLMLLLRVSVRAESVVGKSSLLLVNHRSWRWWLKFIEIMLPSWPNLRYDRGQTCYTTCVLVILAILFLVFLRSSGKVAVKSDKFCEVLSVWLTFLLFFNYQGGRAASFCGGLVLK